MKFLYNVTVRAYRAAISVAAIAGKEKAQQWLAGRENWREKLKADVDELDLTDKKTIWFHCASLGEFEQGRPLIERVREESPNTNIVLTFFSPSGYENKKNYPHADLILYLPLDTPKNARDFLDLVKPKVAVFVKYEFWYHFMKALNDKNIPLILASAIFRDEQLFFKNYGKWYLKSLQLVDHFYVQSEKSKDLLTSHGVENVEVSGDTRFDRVWQLSQKVKSFNELNPFFEDQKVFIAGSSWEKEDEFTEKLIDDGLLNDFKIVIAPHEITESKLKGYEKKWPGQTFRFTDRETVKDLKDKKIMIVDTIGHLSSLYQYATIALIGGGFTSGIHNILEAATYGVPTIFGPNNERFQEAQDLMMQEAAFEVKVYSDLTKVFNILSDESKLQKASLKSKNYVSENTGAVDIIYAGIKKRLLAE
ncbi:3-deoxy-D-manno-octulosonic acid transferase [Salibacter halophilus]|uniref:3-deoxy-D-manno-octulosonic acid transferase n=1 Tax=Salibacter halophilus TaxID=1803916 RepID=A0A6N6M604_9FLAO|nr:glycosyltransferase N-terminal domain-containing protein [Salibacter halophilus]KAB1063455.1 3-deoxy-D-manno-octulosonic acid transferase [Salibacter halophilus]